MGDVLARAYGRRPTLFPSVYQAAAWAVISPRIGTARAAAVTRTLAAEHGETVAIAGETIAAFPTPTALLDLDDVPGLPAEKVRRLHGVARAAPDGELDVARLHGRDPYDYDDPATLAAATPLAPYRMRVAFLLRMGEA